ncbi:RagB/SusD family nutrient uptake outer membrane protein [Solitalea koreensis]|uniref:Starch-binding associating with outer membrane n=1 Tax=Solitalea koreensis TaxID=543615 RepID=A0A521DK18_9SPHI|nr:RagB/SusD family nutrient uptake outer membrane protein [Solitalea koreensis]SMO72059.1 Starch-binding associating with outer membrane [Solitalea koreensis]
MKKYISKIALGICAGVLFNGCTKELDKENFAAVTPDATWSNAPLANAYLNNIYAAMMPGNTYGSGNSTDEGVAYQRQTNAWLTGTATVDSWDTFSQYNNIRTVNIMLDHIDAASFDDASKSKIKGQALFWRAWAYYSLTNAYGGVPLILTAQAPTSDLSQLQVPRNSTTECVNQIVKDLDDAIALLPDSWSGSDVGRIDKGAAMAFKGRVLLFFASPLFNPTNDQSKWQKAYDANLAAKNFLDSKGKGLHTPYSRIWDDELNKEVIMVKRFNYPEAAYGQTGLRPLNWSKDDVGTDRPSLELVNAFPMKNGQAWGDAPRAYDTLFRNRDDRFYANIYYNGSPNQYIAEMTTQNTYLWTYFKSITNWEGATGIQGSHNTITDEGNLWSNSGFYRIKAIDKTITKGTVYNAAVDWPEIRYAEVLMNYGEAANELGKTTEALDVLYQIRKRAGVLAGAASNYGITASSTATLRSVYQNERFVEFCFEGKRWNDIRRWKLFGYLRGLQQRHGLGILLKTGELDVNPKDDINSIYNRFTYKVVTTDKSNIAVSDQYYIYGIPKARLDRNPKLLQNNNWGGTFDPLK